MWFILITVGWSLLHDNETLLIYIIHLQQICFLAWQYFRAFLVYSNSNTLSKPCVHINSRSTWLTKLLQLSFDEHSSQIVVVCEHSVYFP